jgi:hypothetical protein
VGRKNLGRTRNYGHGAMSGTNFKKNQKSKTPYLVHYKLGYLKG